MEIPRYINPKYLLRPVAASALLLGAALPAFAGGGREGTQINVSVGCSTRPAYGVVDLGPHAEINISAANLSSIPTRIQGGTWLYIGKEYSASSDPNEARGYRVVGYSSDPDSFTANMDGFINSIRNQDVTSEGGIQPIRFNPGDRIGIALRRGPYTEGLPAVTEPIARVEVDIPDCSIPSKLTPTCAYGSTQARLQRDVSDPWGQDRTIRLGQSANVGSFHDHTGQFAADTTLIVTGPSTSVTFTNGGTFKPAEVGAYQLKVTTKGQSGAACEDYSVLQVQDN